jgi:uncharacterized protein YigE (DUF2233 family)
MLRRSLIALAVLVAAAALLVWWLRDRQPPSAESLGLPSICRTLTFEGIGYVACEVDTANHEVRLFHADAAGKPFGSLTAFDEAMAAESFLFSMNAGMYHDDLSPVGLYVESGREISRLQTGEGEGNFFLRPNGVFLIGKDGKPAILETSAYAAGSLEVAYATQSGPMLLIDGALHPRFEANGKSRYVRNAVGLRGEGTLVFAISLSEVSFGSFARLFRDALGCSNALYFDGVVSALSNGKKTVIDSGYPTGPIVAVSGKPAPVTQ